MSRSITLRNETGFNLRLDDFHAPLDTFTEQVFLCDLCTSWRGHSEADAGDHRRLMNGGKSPDNQWFHLVRLAR